MDCDRKVLQVFPRQFGHLRFGCLRRRFWNVARLRGNRFTVGGTLAAVPVEPDGVNANRALRRRFRDGRARITEHTAVRFGANLIQDANFPQRAERPLGRSMRA